MAQTTSSRKRVRQNEQRRQRNHARMSRVRTAVKTAEAKTRDGAADAEEAFRRAVSELDRAAQRNLIHPNAAARKKSHLAKKRA